MDLNEAIDAERDRRKREKDALAAKRTTEMQALRVLYEKCTKAALPNWDFRFSEGELIAVYHAGLRGYSDPRTHVWKLDDQNRITDGHNTTSSVDFVGGAKAVDEAIDLIAKMVLDLDEPNR
jgi:hypothetical protein